MVSRLLRSCATPFARREARSSLSARRATAASASRAVTSSRTSTASSGPPAGTRCARTTRAVPSGSCHGQRRSCRAAPSASERSSAARSAGSANRLRQSPVATGAESVGAPLPASATNCALAESTRPSRARCAMPTGAAVSSARERASCRASAVCAASRSNAIRTTAHVASGATIAGMSAAGMKYAARSDGWPSNTRYATTVSASESATENPVMRSSVRKRPSWTSVWCQERGGACMWTGGGIFARWNMPAPVR